MDDKDMRELVNNQKRIIRELKRIADALEKISDPIKTTATSMTSGWLVADTGTTEVVESTTEST